LTGEKGRKVEKKKKMQRKSLPGEEAATVKVTKVNAQKLNTFKREGNKNRKTAKPSTEIING